MHVFKQFLAGSVFALLFSTVNAVVIEQTPIDGGDGSLSSFSEGSQVADNFKFANDVSLTTISWWGSYDETAYEDAQGNIVLPSPESFKVRIFKNDGNAPKADFLYGTVFGTGNATAITDSFNTTVYVYEVAVPMWALAGGVDYYLSVVSDNDAWFWLEGASDNNSGWSRINDGDGWDYNQHDPDTNSVDYVIANMSYRLTANPVATVPAPATLLLMLPAMLWFGRRYILKSKD